MRLVEWNLRLACEPGGRAGGAPARTGSDGSEVENEHGPRLPVHSHTAAVVRSEKHEGNLRSAAQHAPTAVRRRSKKTRSAIIGLHGGTRRCQWDACTGALEVDFHAVCS